MKIEDNPPPGLKFSLKTNLSTTKNIGVSSFRGLRSLRYMRRIFAGFRN